MTTETIKLDVPLHTPGFYLGDPFPTYARLRREAPTFATMPIVFTGWHDRSSFLRRSRRRGE